MVHSKSPDVQTTERVLVMQNAGAMRAPPDERDVDRFCFACARLLRVLFVSFPCLLARAWTRATTRTVVAVW